VELSKLYFKLCYGTECGEVIQMHGTHALPHGLSLWGAVLTPLCSLLTFGGAGMGFADVALTALISATMAAAVFYYAGFQLLKTLGLPRDTTILEFHRFMMSREP
jgi:hypothetical protein